MLETLQKITKCYNKEINMANKKRCLLTGASGAIGVHMIAHIMQNTDWELVALDSFVKDHKGSFDRITKVCEDHPDWLERIQVFYHDLNAPITKREIEQIGSINYILNLASKSDVQGSIDDPAPFVRNNINIILNMLTYAKEIKPEVFLQFSTDEVYGATTKDSKGHAEWDTILPSNPYSASKACQEALAIAYWRSFGVPLIITNTMNNFGEMQGIAKFPAVIQSNIEKGITTKIHAASNGEVGTRYYIHSRNAADAVLFILKNVKPVIHQAGKIDKPVRLNVVGDKQVDNKELIETIAELMGKEAITDLVYFHETNPGHDLHYGLDGAKLKELGWETPVSFKESMKSTIKWQQENHEWIE